MAYEPAEAVRDKVRDLEQAQKAIMNILEDFDSEKGRLKEAQKAVLNILDDFSEEKARLEGTHKATLNILEDFDQEKKGLEEGLKATFNILDDFSDEKLRLEQAQRATFNILEDLNEEKQKAESAGDELSRKIARLREADEEIRNLNEALRKRAVDLEAINREIEAFSYSVSHDLRTPLRAIDGFSQALLEDYSERLDDQGRHYLERVRDGAQRMGGLIDDMLKLSRITRAELNREDVDISALAWEVASELGAREPGRQVEFVIAPGVKAPCDPRLLRIALMNFFDNALKFTRPHPTARIEFGLMEKDVSPVYYVRDDGVGFDVAYAGKLFGAFQRLHDARVFPGTGIGLATVRRVMRKHGGEVWAESEVEKGSTFYFTLNEGGRGNG